MRKLKKTIDKKVDLLRGNKLKIIIVALKVKAIKKEKECDNEESGKDKANQEE